MTVPRGRMLPLVLLAPILSSCATMDTGAIDAAGISRICSAWQPVTWSSRDTPETIRDVKANNAGRDAFCASKK